MRHGRRQLDMRHAIATHLLDGDLDAALFADNALVLHALILAAQALVVLHRTEDARAEQTVALRFEGAIVDRFRLLHLTMRPAQDLIRTGERNPNAVEGRNLLSDLEDVHQLLVGAGRIAAVRSCFSVGFSHSSAAPSGTADAFP